MLGSGGGHAAEPGRGGLGLGGLRGFGGPAAGRGGRQRGQWAAMAGGGRAPGKPVSRGATFPVAGRVGVHWGPVGVSQGSGHGTALGRGPGVGRPPQGCGRAGGARGAAARVAAPPRVRGPACPCGSGPVHACPGAAAAQAPSLRVPARPGWDPACRAPGAAPPPPGRAGRKFAADPPGGPCGRARPADHAGSPAPAGPRGRSGRRFAQARRPASAGRGGAPAVSRASSLPRAGPLQGQPLLAATPRAPARPRAWWAVGVAAAGSDRAASGRGTWLREPPPALRPHGSSGRGQEGLRWLLRA